MIRNIRPLAVLVVALIMFAGLAPRLAQASTADFSFDSFAGTYYLERNSSGVATLTIEEDMVVEFPLASHLYGIRRSLPESYQGHNLNLKIISVTDTAGNPVNYRLSSDGNGNEVIVTGDPDITLSGIQNYRIKYQTSGVVAFNGNSDQFLIDVNGRGWQEPFKSVKAFINISKDFSADLTSKPFCYIGYLNQTINACVIESNTTNSGTEITADTSDSLTANHALVVGMDFKSSTFNQKHSDALAKITILVGALIIIGSPGLLWLYKNTGSQNKTRRQK